VVQVTMFEPNVRLLLLLGKLSCHEIS